MVAAPVGDKKGREKSTFAEASADRVSRLQCRVSKVAIKWRPSQNDWGAVGCAFLPNEPNFIYGGTRRVGARGLQNLVDSA